jgi:hypothetical protein
MDLVRIHRGTFGYGSGRPIEGVVLPLVSPPAPSTRGGFVLSVPAASLGRVGRTSKILVQSESDYELFIGNSADVTPVGHVVAAIGRIADIATAPSFAEAAQVAAPSPAAAPVESDDEIRARIAQRFAIYGALTAAVAHGEFSSLVVSGAPGIGKTYTATQVLRSISQDIAMAGDPNSILREGSVVEEVSGKTSAIGMFQTLYYNRQAGRVVLFDDCDSVFDDADGLNVLKAALSDSKIRRVSWNTESRALKDADIPRTFDFEGSVIFITNMDWTNLRQNDSRRPHLEAVMNRAMYVDLTIHDARSKLIHIETIARGPNGMLQKYGLTEAAADQVWNFFVENYAHFNRRGNATLRTIKKICGLYRSQRFGSTDWQKMALVAA